MHTYILNRLDLDMLGEIIAKYLSYSRYYAKYIMFSCHFAIYYYLLTFEPMTPSARDIYAAAYRLTRHGHSLSIGTKLLS